MRIIKKNGIKIIGASLLALFIFSSLPWGKAFYKTLIILPEFIPDSPVKTINLFTKNPQILEVNYPSQKETIYADLWLPSQKGKYPAAVLHLGVDIDRKDERVQKLANAFARSGIIILVPNIPSLGKRRVLAEAKSDLITSFEYVKSLQNTNTDKVGFIGFCASGGLVILASEDAKISENVSYIVTVNPYFDLSNLYDNITTRKIRDNDGTHEWQPNFKTVEIYNRETIGLLENKHDQDILNDHLTLIGQQALEEGKFPQLNIAESKELSSDAKFTYNLLINKDPDKVLFYQENASPAQKNFLRELSPSTNIKNLKAKLFILMDRNNIYIPYTEAELLDKALGVKEHLFVETKILPAGDLAKSLPLKDYLGEAVKIFRFVYSVLSEIS